MTYRRPIRLLAATCLVVGACATAVVSDAPSDAAPAALPASTLTWTAPRVVDPPSGGPTAVSCPLTTYCMVVDKTGFAVPLVDQRRSPRVKVANVGLTSVSCVGPAFCFATSSNGGVFRYNSKTWTRSATVTGGTGGSQPSVSCASRELCVVTMGQNAYRFNGTHWSAATTLTATAHWLDDVSCAGTDFCMAVEYGDGNWAWRYNGSTWRRVARLFHAGGNELFAISCSSASFCAAVGEGGMTETFNGTTWSVRDLVNTIERNDLESVSCRNHEFCVAVASYGSTVVWRGSASGWQRAGTVPYGRSMHGVSCASTTYCIAVDALGYKIQFHGAHWGGAALVDRTDGDVGAISCGSAQLCLAADDAGNVLRFAAGTWTPPHMVDRYADPQTEGSPVLDCVGENFCLMLDWRGRAFRYDGAAWHATASSPFGGAAISCVLPTWCMAIGAAEISGTPYNEFSIFEGSSWTKPVAIHRLGGIIGYGAPRCAGRSFCVALFGGNKFSTWNGHVWSTPALISTSHDFFLDLDCTSNAACESDSFGGALWIYDGASWHQHASIPTPVSHPGPMTCRSVRFCVDGDEGGNVFDYDGSSWSEAGSQVLGTIGVSTYSITVLACASATICIASDGVRAAVSG